MDEQVLALTPLTEWPPVEPPAGLLHPRPGKCSALGTPGAGADLQGRKPQGQCRSILRCDLQQSGHQGAGRALGGKESTPEMGPRTVREGFKPAGESVGYKAVKVTPVEPHFPLPVLSVCSLQLAVPVPPSPSFSLLIGILPQP